MRDALYLSIAASAWTAAAYKARAWLRDRENTSLALISGMIAAIGLLLAFSSPRLYIAFDDVVGVANLAMAIIYSSAVLFVIGARTLMLDWMKNTRQADPAQGRRRTLLTIAAAWTGALVAFSLGRPDSVEHPEDFATVYADAPGVVTFLAIYLILFGTCMASLGSLCRRYAAELRTGRPWMARGLCLIAYGSWAILVYCAAKLVGVLGHWSSVNLDVFANTVAPFSASVGALLVITGFAVPAVGSRLGAWRLVRRLHPLWLVATAHEPEVRMEELRWWWPSKSVQWAATRQMAEIRDVQRGIRRHVEAELIHIARDRGRSAGLEEHQVVALMEAAALRRGIQNRNRGYLPAHCPASVVMGGGELPADEHRHLLMVSDAYKSRLTQDILEALP
ncbi:MULTISPECIES: MAB_1171c family putative transporter [unclassified Streptomyces]|uniref:MAB_1171c family putative transporter n=1 Tax=unclassified Streptomyces TaxID=2593676 RepID=UPI003329A753